MLSAFTNSLKIPELRQKIFFTLALLFIARVGANIPLPGMNVGPIQDFFADQANAGGGLVGMFNMFNGGDTRDCRLPETPLAPSEDQC